MKKKVLIIGAIILLVLAVVLFFFFRNTNGELVVNTAPASEGEVSLSVTATGYVQPVDQVEVGTQVSGVVEKIYVDYNSQVKKGQLLAELDKSTLKEKVTQANASLVGAQSSLTTAQQNFNRTEQLYNQKAATQTAYEDAQDVLVQAQASLANAKANLHQAQVNLSYAEIYSPIDGVVLERAVEEGQTVAASFSTPTLFSIANDLKKMQVEADVDEADIGQVKDGQKVTFTVDAFPDDRFEGTVMQIRLQPVVTSNVVTYTVIIDAPNPEEKLYPGMTANITIQTKVQTGIIVSNEALSFTADVDFLRKMNVSPDYMENISKAYTGEKGVWIETANSAEHKTLKTGLSDGVSTIVESGLNLGDKVVVSVTKVSKKEASGEAVSNPLMPQRRR